MAAAPGPAHAGCYPDLRERSEVPLVQSENRDSSDWLNSISYVCFFFNYFSDLLGNFFVLPCFVWIGFFNKTVTFL